MSMSRRCDIFKAVDGKWYMLLGKFEYAQDAEDCQAFGPYNSPDEAEAELQDHSNPGCVNFDDSGIRLVPQNPFKSKPYSNFFSNQPF